jgi:hypothetical protein
MTPLEAAQAIIDARARATQGECSCESTPFGWVVRFNIDCLRDEGNAQFFALAANHAAAVAQAYMDAMQDNARLRAALVVARDALREFNSYAPEYDMSTDLAAIDAALEKSR